MKLLLDREVDKGEGAFNGDTAQHLAAQGGHEVVVNILLDRGVYDADLKNPSGDTALHLAVKGGHDKVAKITP